MTIWLNDSADNATRKKRSFESSSSRIIPVIFGSNKRTSNTEDDNDSSSTCRDNKITTGAVASGKGDGEGVSVYSRIEFVGIEAEGQAFPANNIGVAVSGFRDVEHRVQGIQAFLSLQCKRHILR